MGSMVLLYIILGFLGFVLSFVIIVIMTFLFIASGITISKSCKTPTEPAKWRHSYEIEDWDEFHKTLKCSRCGHKVDLDFFL